MSVEMRKSSGDFDSWYKEHMKKRNSVPETMLRHRMQMLREMRRERDDQLRVPDEVTGSQVMQVTPPSQMSRSQLAMPRKSLQENGNPLKPGHGSDTGRRKSFDVLSDTDRRPSVLGHLMQRINLQAMKKSDQKGSGSTKSWTKSAGGGSSNSSSGGGGGGSGGASGGGGGGGGSGSAGVGGIVVGARASPQMGKKLQGLAQTSATADGGGVGGINNLSAGPMPSSGGGLQSGQGALSSQGLLQLGLGHHEDGPVAGTSSEDLAGSTQPDNYSDPGTDDVDGSENSHRAKQAIETLQAKILKTKEAIKKEQNNKEAIVNEYLLVASDKTPSTRIKTLFEKKNQKSAQNINQLQKKLETYTNRLTEVETHGYTGHKQAKEVLRDVGQGLNTIVSKPKEIAHLIKNKFGSADNISQLKLEDGAGESDGKSGGTLPASFHPYSPSFKYASDDENSSITSGSGLGGLHGSPHSTQNIGQLGGLSHVLLAPLTDELSSVRDTTRKTNDVLQKLTEDFEEYRNQMQSEVSVLRSMLDDERFRVERLEEQLNDLTELHQHEMHNLKQDLISTEEKIEYRLDERTTDLSDLVDNTSTRISRLEQQQQQQQILSMEMVENANFRTIISKLINVLFALLAVILVCVSTFANFFSPFIHSRSRLVISVVIAALAWLVYHNYSYLESAGSSIRNFVLWPWS